MDRSYASYRDCDVGTGELVWGKSCGPATAIRFWVSASTFPLWNQSPLSRLGTLQLFHGLLDFDSSSRLKMGVSCWCVEMLVSDGWQTEALRGSRIPYVGGGISSSVLCSWNGNTSTRQVGLLIIWSQCKMGLNAVCLIFFQIAKCFAMMMQSILHFNTLS